MEGAIPGGYQANDEGNISDSSSVGEDSKPPATGGPEGKAGEALTPEEEARQKEQAEADAKRQKRLALNRKAAHESRKRKKVKFAALTKSLEDLQRENEETQEQNDLLRELLSAPQMNRFSARREMLQAENTQLRLALLTALQSLTDEMGQRNSSTGATATNSNTDGFNVMSSSAAAASALLGTGQGHLQHHHHHHHQHQQHPSSQPQQHQQHGGDLGQTRGTLIQQG